ncbi:MAG: glycosyl hydrolase, partial [Deltaproteobacteria bacterium]
HLISPLIYGTAYNPQRVGQDDWLWETGTTARRWGGNNSSRYNWKLGNAWNCAFDWFFKNANYTNDPGYTWRNFFKENRDHHAASALSIPTLGYVAKDTDSTSFPVSVYGPQQYESGDAGNGKRAGGGLIESPDPSQTSVPAPPAFMRDWIRAIRAYDQQVGGRSVQHYILDNEPALWNSTHRDVHPKALTYDELLARTIAYGTEVRREDPQALIAGPAEWGWPNYFFSARDAEVGFHLKPDRLAHGDRPLMEWYLSRLHAHAQKTGTRILDIVDLHFYPQEDGIYGQSEKTDPASAALRLRATRSLWDPTYKDESWINDRIRLLPRLKQMIADNYPGLKMSLGEYNFGGERHISGALAQAEALGRFAEYDVYAAYYWTYPPRNSCSYFAFRAFRNYDGQGAHFLDRYVAAKGDPKTSIFVSQNDSKD